MSTVVHSFGPPVEEEHRVELGWQEVGSGLLRIVMGYSLSVLSVIVGVGLILLVIPLHDEDETLLVLKRTQVDLIVLAGLGVMGLAGMVSYAWIMMGNWRCLMHAPERNHAKWLMFASMTCIVMGPALGGVSGTLGGGSRIESLDRDEKAAPVTKAKSRSARVPSKSFVTGAEEHLTVQDTSGILNLASGALGLLSGVLFLLFLRAVAGCFGDEARVRLVEIYLMFLLLSAGFTFFLLISQPKLAANSDFLLALAVGWLLEFVFFLVVILKVRGSIIRGLENHPFLSKV